MKTKKEILEIIRLLKEEYPLAECSLDYDHAWQLLVSVRLAAQCTDARVNIVTEELFAKYPSVAALAAAEPEEIEEIVRPCGLGHSKARDISLAMRMLMRDFGGKVPEPKKVEMALWKVIPPEESNDFCHRLVLHGRAVCNARSPRCEACCVKELCSSYRDAQRTATKKKKEG